MADGVYGDAEDETEVEEEVIVVIDDEYTDHTRDEVVAEFVTYSELPPERPAPTPPRPKGAFEMYNDQLKASMAKPKSKENLVKPPEEEVQVKTGWMGKMKKKMSSKSTKSVEEDFAVEPEKPKSSTSIASNGSSGHIRKGAAGWWGMGKAASVSESSDIEESTTFGATEDVPEPAKAAADPPGAPPVKTDDAPPNSSAVSSVKSPKTKRKSVVLARWPPANEAIEDPDEPSAKAPIAKSSPVVKKVVLPKWLQPADPAELEEAKRQAALRKAAPTRRWKKPEAKDIPAPVNSSENVGSSPVVVRRSIKVSTQAFESSETETDELPLKPISPRPAKGSITNRYLSNVVKTDPTEQERMAQIEADRARGRWDSKAYVRGDVGNESETKQRKNWKFLQAKEKEAPIDEGPVIKIQALARGYLARKRVAQLVDSMIADLMRSLDAVKAAENARYKENQHLLEEEEFKRWQERKAERRKNEEEAIKKKMYDEQYGLPQWWMEMIPHKTMSQKEYDRAMKKDKGFTVIDYKLPPRSKTTLDPVTEEENEGGDENDKKTKKKGLFSFLGKKESAPSKSIDTKEDTPTVSDQPKESAPLEAKKIWM